MGAGSWLWANKEWFFQGLGVTLIVALVTLLVRLFRRKHEAGVASSLTEQAFFHAGLTETPKSHRGWLLVEKIPGFKRIARERIYTEQEIGRRVRVTVRSEGEGMIFWNADGHGTLRAWIDFVNLNPFPLKIECMTGHATVAGSTVAEIKVIDRHEVPALAWHDLFFEMSLNSAQIDQIKFQLKHRADAPAGLNLRAYLKTEIREIILNRMFVTGNRTFQNFGQVVNGSFFDRLVPVASGGYSIDPKNGEAVCPKCASENRMCYLMKSGGNFYCQACKTAIKGVSR